MLRAVLVFAVVVAVTLAVQAPPPQAQQMNQKAAPAAGGKVPPVKGKDHRDKPIDKDHFHGGEHDPDYDHEAVLGSRDEEEAFSHLEPEEAKKKLGELVDKMDTNKDGKISPDELRDWVLNSFRLLDDEDANSRFNDNDENGDKKVSWPEFLDKMYGYTPAEVENLKKDTSDEMKEFSNLIGQDQKKFALADANGDGFLDKEEFKAFAHPYNHERMHKLEMEISVGEHDKDNDTRISLAEYIGDVSPDEDDDGEYNKTQTEAFKKLDKDNNGFLEGAEILAWVIPDHTPSAVEEAKHLIKESDADNDGLLTKEEIQNKHTLWVGSQAGTPHFDDRDEL